MERAFVVLRSRGPGWDDSKPLEAQLDWAAHAAFMDGLFEQRFAAFAGPLEGTRDALLILRANHLRRKAANMVPLLHQLIEQLVERLTGPRDVAIRQWRVGDTRTRVA